MEILLGDVCKLDTLPYFDVCISNTPYQVCMTLHCVDVDFIAVGVQVTSMSTITEDLYFDVSTGICVASGSQAWRCTLLSSKCERSNVGPCCTYHEGTQPSNLT